MYCRFVECPYCEELTPNEVAFCINCKCPIPVAMESGCTGVTESPVYPTLLIAMVYQ